MSVTVRKAGVFKPSKQPYVKVGATWRPAKKVYVKKAGVWIEAWPQAPNPPRTVHIVTAEVSDNISITGTWIAPAAGAKAADKYQVRIVFINPNGTLSATAWVDRTLAQLSYTNDNNGNGWQHRSGQKVYLEAVSVINATTYSLERRSTVANSETDITAGIPAGQPPVVVPPSTKPVVPSAFTVTISECELTETWTHVGGNTVDYFEIQTWLGSSAPVTYKVTKTLRKWETYPWNAATIGRNTVSTQIRAVGQGGASAWVKVTGVMPGPVIMSNYKGYKGTPASSSFFTTVDHIDDGVKVYTQVYGVGTAVLQTTAAGNAGAVTYGYTGSSGHARDNTTKRRMGFLPYNFSNTWTGRPQWGPWAVKMPNPVYIPSVDCNTWWSIPIPGKWRTNPQAENWFYQGKSISGNSYGTLFYQSTVKNYFASARVGYSVAITSWDVYIKRTNTGGLVAAVALNAWTHDRDNDVYDAAPGLVDGPQAGPSLVRDQKVWLGLPSSWFTKMISGVAKGISFYVPPGQADNQLRSEIGNVSNRYMILDKPNYGSTLDGQKPGTLRVYHDG